MLAQIAVDYPGRVAAVDVHYNPSDSFFLQEAYDRIHYYPPPYYGMYMSPWLWYDGNQHAGFDTLVWESLITARMALAAPITITIGGSYDPGSGTGNASIRFQNDSSATIDGRVIIVITEDSLFYPAPNGQVWHNHVPRDYLPDHNGTTVSIPTGDYVDVNQPFTINPVWNDDYCKLIAFIQNDVMQPDSTKEIWQGAMVDIMEIGIQEHKSTVRVPAIACYPNPASDKVKFSFSSTTGSIFDIKIFDISGREIRSLQGRATDNPMIQEWDLLDNSGNNVVAGVYLYHWVNEGIFASGKLVIR